MENNTTKLEEKLFFEGRYQECLDLIRNTIVQLSDYDDTKENLAILGSQCLFEMGNGSEISSFFETSYHRELLFLPPTVFFVYINYLLHKNEYKLSINLLKEFREKGKPMNKHEYNQWVHLVVCDGFINHRNYKKAIKFLRKQHRLEDSIRDNLMEQVKTKMKQDLTFNFKIQHFISDDDDNEHDYNDLLMDSDQEINHENDENNEANEEKKTETETETKTETEINVNIPQTRIGYIKAKCYYIITVLQTHITRKRIFTMIFVSIIIWIFIRIGKRNKKRINRYISDFRKLIIMSIGKSRITG